MVHTSPNDIGIDHKLPIPPPPDTISIESSRDSTVSGAYSGEGVSSSMPPASATHEILPNDLRRPRIRPETRAGHDTPISSHEQLDVNNMAGMERTDNGHGLSQEDEKLSGPHLFVQNPRKYREDVNSLQERIFKLGEPALRNIEERGDMHVLSPPLSTSSNPEASGHIQSMIRINLDLVCAINEGQTVLAAEEFSSTTYNIIVLDPDRDDVLKVVPIQKDTLQVLTNLLQEVAGYCGPPMEHNLLEESLDDVNEALRLILRYLGLNVPAASLSGALLLYKLDQILKLVFSTLSVLFLGLVSFITSQLCLETVSGNLPGLNTFTQLAIEVPGGLIFMTPRRLLCLDAFIKNPVWTFSTVPGFDPILSEVQAKRYYLSIFLADFADLWGPLLLRFLGDSTDLVSEITVRGGTIQAVSPANQSIIVRANETLCHWYGWMDIISDKLAGQPKHIFPMQRLLIGTPGDDNSDTLKDPILLISNKTCACKARKRYSDSHNAFELNTKVSSWSVAERTAQISGGAYVNVLYGHTWKFNASWTLKDVIVLDWVDHIREPSHLPKPFYLDYRVVLNISRCTGHSRRMSLWDLLREGSLRRYLREAFSQSFCTDFEILVQLFPSEASFVDVWRSIQKEGQEMLKTVAKEILTILRSTGLGEDGYLQAWDVTSFDRLDGRKVKPSWSTMVKDDSACATFAIITDKCIRFTGSTTPPSPKLASGVFSTILSTAICITTPEPLVSYERHFYTSQNSLQGDELRPEWALNSTTFKQWKVKLSEDPPSSLESSRRQLLESARNEAGPDPEALAKTESRQFARLLRDQKRCLNGNVTIQPPNIPPQASRATTSRTPSERISDEHGSLNGHAISRSGSHIGRNLICDGALDFKNGKGETIGLLFLEPPQSIDLYTITEGSSLTARWEERKPGFLSAIKAKEKVIDSRFMGWAERRMRGVLPWAVSRVANMYADAAEPFAVEHIRGGNLGTGQKILQTYIW